MTADKVQQIMEVAVVGLALLVAVVLVAVAAAVAMTAVHPLAPPARWPRIPQPAPSPGLSGLDAPTRGAPAMRQPATASRLD
jgi:hypothetical protein